MTRGAALQCKEMMKELNKGSMYRMQPAEEQKQLKPLKPHKIKLNNVYEHQFYDDFFEVQ